jgi:hypothetical protein
MKLRGHGHQNTQYEAMAERFSPPGGRQHTEMPTNLQEWADQQMGLAGFPKADVSRQLTSPAIVKVLLTCENACFIDL